jgi:hypothetical protein
MQTINRECDSYLGQQMSEALHHLRLLHVNRVLAGRAITLLLDLLSSPIIRYWCLEGNAVTAYVPLPSRRTQA